MVATPPTVQPPSLRTKFVDGAGGLMPTSLQFLQQMWLAINNLGTATASSAPDSADYLVRTANSSLTAERVVTDVAGGVTWDWATAGQAKASVGAAYTGGTAIVTLGTIGTGVWNGTDIAIADGGTGASTAAGARTNLGLGTAAVRSTMPVEYVIACSDETTALTTGTGKTTFHMPHAMTVTEVRASLTTAQTSGSILTTDINKGGASILSTKLTVDNTEKTSTTATTAAVISDGSLADDAEMTVDIDQVGDGTAKGLKVTLIGTREV